MRRIIKSVLAIALIAAMLSCSALAASYGAKVLTSSMPVYGYSNGKKVQQGTLSQGTAFKVTEMSGDWAKISYRGKTIYARLENIIFDKRIKAVAIRDAALKFITRESYARGVYYTATLAAGTKVYAAGFKGDQMLITNASGSALGYVKKSALTKQ